MAKAYDLIGQKFGNLTVIGVVSDTAKKKKRWECLCSCGNTVTVEGYRLITGKRTSCQLDDHENKLRQRAEPDPITIQNDNPSEAKVSSINTVEETYSSDEEFIFDKKESGDGFCIPMTDEYEKWFLNNLDSLLSITPSRWIGKKVRKKVIDAIIFEALSIYGYLPFAAFDMVINWFGMPQFDTKNHVLLKSTFPAKKIYNNYTGIFYRDIPGISRIFSDEAYKDIKEDVIASFNLSIAEYEFIDKAMELLWRSETMASSEDFKDTNWWDNHHPEIAEDDDVEYDTGEGWAARYLDRLFPGYLSL